LSIKEDGKYQFEFRIVPVHAKDEKVDKEIFGKTAENDVRVLSCELLRPKELREVLTPDVKPKELGKVLKALKADPSSYLVARPQTLLLIQFVRFAPGKGLKDHMRYYREEFEKRCLDVWGMSRHDLGIHEILTFVTSGEYDLIILLEAKNMEAYSKFVATLNQPNASGTTSTQTVVLVAFHPG